jgi:hypothetical protein
MRREVLQFPYSITSSIESIAPSRLLHTYENSLFINLSRDAVLCERYKSRTDS